MANTVAVGAGGLAEKDFGEEDADGTVQQRADGSGLLRLVVEVNRFGREVFFADDASL